MATNNTKLRPALILVATALVACSATDLDAGNSGVGPAGPAGDTGPAGPPGAGIDGGTTSTDAGVVPTHAPAAVTFIDTDLDPESVEGSITVARATNESDVTSYAVYYGKSATEKLYLTPIFAAPVSGTGDITFSLSVAPPPAGATHLLAFSQNGIGEMSSGVATQLHDVAPTAVELSTGVTFDARSAMVTDTVHERLLMVVAAEENGGRATLIRCTYDGSSCEHVDVSGGSSMQFRGGSVLYDAPSDQLYIAVNEVANLGHAYFTRCAFDGTSCTVPVDMTSTQGLNSGALPLIAIDSINSKLDLVTWDDSWPAPNQLRPSLFQCGTNGDDCTHIDVSSDADDLSGSSLAIDTAHDKLIIGEGGGDGVSYFSCNLAATECLGGAAAPVGEVPLHRAGLAVDPAHSKTYLEWGTDDGRAALSICPYLEPPLGVASPCLYQDISAGRPAHSATGVGGPPALDVAAGHLYVALVDGDDSFRIHVNRCDLNGENCRSFRMSTSSEDDIPFSIVLMPTPSHFVVSVGSSIFFPQ